jgi:hypothetical protein
MYLTTFSGFEIPELNSAAINCNGYWVFSSLGLVDQGNVQESVRNRYHFS